MKANDYEGRRNISGERVRMKRLVPDFELPLQAKALGITADWLLSGDVL